MSNLKQYNSNYLCLLVQDIALSSLPTRHSVQNGDFFNNKLNIPLWRYVALIQNHETQSGSGEGQTINPGPWTLVLAALS